MCMINSLAEEPEKMDIKEVRTGLTPANLHLTLPSIIYAVPGIECNIYFENVIADFSMN